jgi:hypothetical protein
MRDSELETQRPKEGRRKQKPIQEMNEMIMELQEGRRKQADSGDERDDYGTAASDSALCRHLSLCFSHSPSLTLSCPG